MPNLRKIEAAVPVIREKKRVVAYARVSMQSERMLHTLSAQVSYYSGLIQKNPDWEYAGVYADDFISGTNTVKRDEFKRMLADCGAGKIDIILTKSISRFARNTVDLLETVRHLKDLGVEVRFEKERIRSMYGDSELMLTILASFAQEESRSIWPRCCFLWGAGEEGSCFDRKKIYYRQLFCSYGRFADFSGRPGEIPGHCVSPAEKNRAPKAGGGAPRPPSGAISNAYRRRERGGILPGGRGEGIPGTEIWGEGDKKSEDPLLPRLRQVSAGVFAWRGQKTCTKGRGPAGGTYA